MTVEVILNKIKYLLIHNVSIHIIFYRNKLINECVRKIFFRFPERQTKRRKDVKTKRRFFWRDLEELTFLIKKYFKTAVHKMMN